MRPLLLEITGIGPFVDTQRLDFTSMDPRALFLIHGPTGQGKSFIFDALCYALYADTPAGREGHLKSDFLPDGVEPRVELRFALGTDTYRVWRSLPWNRPKKSGSGLTSVPEAQELVRTHPDGSQFEHLASKKTDVNRILNQLLGLDARQFRQVVMIPQGEFRKLLLSESGEREILLERLFDTRIYRDIQERLKLMEDEASLGERGRADRRDQLVADITDLWRGHGLLLSQEEDEAFIDSLEKAGAELKAWAAHAAEAAETAAASRDRAVSDFVRSERLHADHLQALELEKRRSELAGKDGVMEKLKSRLEINSRARSLKDRYNELLHARRSDDTAAEELKAAVLSLEAARNARTELEQRSAESAGWRDISEKLSSRIALLAGFRDQEPRRRAINESLTAANARLEKVRVSRGELDEKKQAVEGRRTGLDGELRVLESGGAAEEKQRSIAALETLLSLNQNHLQLSARLRENEVLLEDRRRVRDNAAGTLENLRTLRESNMAGELAGGLKDGVPCPVCGSVHHPHPHPEGKGPTVEEVAAAAELLDGADSALSDIRSEHGAFQGRILEIENKLAPLAEVYDVSDAGERIAALRGELSKEKTLRQERDHLLGVDLPALSADSVSLAAETESTGAEVRGLAKQLAEIDDAWFAAIALWPADEVEDPPGLTGLSGCLNRWDQERGELETRLKRLDEDTRQVLENLRSCETVEELRRNRRAEAESHRNGREEDFKNGLSQAGFTGEESLIAAMDAAPGIEKDSEELRGWEAGKAETATLFAEVLKRIAGRPDPDLEGFARARDLAVAADNEAAAKLGKLRNAAERLAGLDVEYRRLEEKNREEERRNGLLRRLSGQVRGVLPPKISLNRYFLARRLEEVLVQATRRLTLLSRGRFTLKRRDEGRTAAAQAGLDLLVSDAWTGTERPVNTLSGGQLFMASLSLALGLADVVQARSGGVRLEALFIDEGFGTLDDDALQGVLTVLNDLRENRMVGVISHVPELKRQIADRIEVSASDVGSKARLIRGV